MKNPEIRLLSKPCILFSGRGEINEEPACRSELVERRVECTESVHEDSDLSGIARRAKPECIFDEPREQKTRFPKKSIDYLIVGQGLAGTVLALTLDRLGLPYRIAADLTQPPASAIAAGLLNPITGKRLAKAPLMEAYLEAATAFYPLQEEILGASFFRKRSFLRLLKSKEEAALLQKRLLDPAFQPYMSHVYQPYHFEHLQDEWGSFALDSVYTLDVPVFLEKAKAYFEAKQVYIPKALKHPLALEDGVLHWEGESFQAIVFCEGYGALANPLFSWLPFRPAKGEILTLDLLQGLPDTVVNKEKWIVPTSPTRIKLGATYSWDDLSSQPSVAAKGELLSSLKDILHVASFPLLLKHEAAVRPCTEDALPFLGQHPQYRSCFIFNGFGSRGSLLAPFYAESLVQHLRHQKPLAPPVNIVRYLNRYERA